MEVVEALQQAGFNKYEAEAYVALAAHGPLTGYEVGKRSQVPLSRSYEILERLTEKGWALRQPGDPPRFAALPPHAALERLRAEQAERLTELTSALTALASQPQAPGMWVLKGRAAIVSRLSDLISTARERVELALAPGAMPQIELMLAKMHDIAIVRTSPPRGDDDMFAACIDARIVCIGSLAPADTCQALVSDDPTLIATTRASFTPRPLPAPAAVSETDWLAWELRKQQRVRQRTAS